MIITVSGAHSGVGKTRLVERLLKARKGWSALKVTLAHKGACPTGRECGSCSSLNSEFDIVSDEKIIERKGKDTYIFKKAGARQVLWLKATPEGLRRGLQEAMARFKKAKGVIIETTSGPKYLKPDLAIFVKDRQPYLKRSAKEAIKKVDLILTV